MTCKVAVTYEFELRPPVTWRGTVVGWSSEAVVRKATLIARKTLKPVGWTSMVCCILERDSLVEPDREVPVLAGETNGAEDDPQPSERVEGD
jgi:hypothetical protein